VRRWTWKFEVKWTKGFVSKEGSEELDAETKNKTEGMPGGMLLRGVR
jgi:hypothetical protein